MTIGFQVIVENVRDVFCHTVYYTEHSIRQRKLDKYRCSTGNNVCELADVL